MTSVSNSQLLDHLKRIERMLVTVLRVQVENQEIIMTELTDALDLAEANAAKETDAETAIEALLTDVVKQLQEASAGASPAVIARVNAVAQGIADRAARLSAAVVANTPTAPPAP